jgi:3-oxoacyl-(acyl-carrier-protein) synthase/NAD(P)-dependent dehydrogenase (short-subunit alcohol dehydrogenase family)/acyl carrier protein
MDGFDIAVTGMAGHFPGSPDLETFWKNLAAGKEAISFFDADNTARSSGERVINAAGLIDGVDLFDAEFFGYSPREAELMDPQQRLFLEYAWIALESAGYDPLACPGSVGVFGGAGMNLYLLQLLAHHRSAADIDDFQLMLLNNRDFLTTRVSYKLNLKGPSINIQTACSTSLVAVHCACTALLNYHCDMALAGGVSVRMPRHSGYVFHEGMILSPDGHCRAFDAGAQGTVPGEGVGIVVLKRLDDALADRDHIRAVIKGGAINNDGFQKMGFTAPSEAGQTEAIVSAQALAGVEPDGITYVEAHGTGTRIGDPIEIAALREAFASCSERKQFCALGAVKTNIGHLDAAAGVAGLIKTILCLERQMIPPTLHYRSANPQIEFEQTPFYVNTELRPWESDGPRRAGVSSFGFGGTNAHLVLEEARIPERANRRLEQSYVLPLSARTAGALKAAAEELANYLESHQEIDLGDVAYTLQVGRHAFEHRQVVVCSNRDEGIRMLRNGEASSGPVEIAPPLDGRRVPLPTYPFERKRYWVDGEPQLTQIIETSIARVDFSNWFTVPSWNRADLIDEDFSQRRYSVFCDQHGVGESLVEQLRERGQEVISVNANQIGSLDYQWPTDIVHCLSVFAEDRQKGFESLLHLSHALAARTSGAPLRLLVVTNGLFEVTGGESIDPQKSTILGPCKVMPQEFPNLQCQCVDIGDSWCDQASKQLLREALNASSDSVIAYRHGHRWVQSLQTLRLTGETKETRLRKKGVYLITGGLGGVGRIIAEYLARSFQARLVLVSRATEQTDLRAFSSSLKQWEEAAGRDLNTEFRRELYPLLRQLCVAYIQRYLIGAHDGIQPQFQRFHRFMLRVIAEGSGDAKDPTELKRKLALSFPQFRQLYELLDYCAQNYPQVLSGEVKGLDVLFPKGQTDFLERSLGELTNLVDSTVYKRVLQKLLVALSEKQTTPLRILEIGAGTGLLTKFLLLTLRGKNVEYCFTDIGTSFLIAAQEWTTAADREILTFAKLDITRDPAEQGFAPGSFDVILGLDVVHATPDMSATLRNLRSLLAPGGWLALIEMVKPWPWIEMIWGLTDGWWHCDDFRRDEGTALASLPQWHQLLSQQEFAAFEIYPQSEAARAEAEYGLMLAQTSHTQSFKHLEELGADVFVGKADVSDAEQLTGVVAAAYERFGKINGVIHAAGVPGGGLMVRQTPETAEEVFRSKVEGTMVLHRLFEGEDLDFFLLWSSIASFIGGAGQATYTAASSVLDAYAQSQRSGPRFTCSLNWPLWNNVGTAVPVQQRHLEWSGSPREDVIEPADAIRALERVLALDHIAQVAISPVPLEILIERFRELWRHEKDVLVKGKPAREQKSRRTHARPELVTTYAAPQDEIEKQIASIWSDALGVGELGREDNFFDLGGDSLVAVKVISQIKRTWDIELSAVAMFELPTIAKLAETIRGVNGEGDSFAESRREIEDLQSKRKAARERRRIAQTGD